MSTENEGPFYAGLRSGKNAAPYFQRVSGRLVRLWAGKHDAAGLALGNRGAAGARFGPTGERIKPGEMVRVMDGPLRGLEGTLIERSGEERKLCVAYATIALCKRDSDVEICACVLQHESRMKPDRPCACKKRDLCTVLY